METETLKQQEVKESESLHINYHEVKKASLVLRSINHKLRQKILELVATEDEITVTEIYVKLRLEQSVASQHLAILRRAGVLNTNRKGKFINYSLNKERLEQVDKIVKELLS